MRIHILCLLTAGTITAGCCNTVSCAPRPQTWAAHPDGAAWTGMNFYKVDKNLYRGSQPSPDQIRALKAMGIKTIVNLRETDTDGPQVQRLGMKYVTIPMTALRPRQDQAVAFLRVMSDPANYPVFVHCKKGADRTGVMCAMYRVAVQGWEKDEAIREFTTGGYSFNVWLQNLVRMVQSSDFDQLRKLASLNAPVKVAGAPIATATP